MRLGEILAHDPSYTLTQFGVFRHKPSEIRLNRRDADYCALEPPEVSKIASLWKDPDFSVRRLALGKLTYKPLLKGKVAIDMVSGKYYIYRYKEIELCEQINHLKVWLDGSMSDGILYAG